MSIQVEVQVAQSRLAELLTAVEHNEDVVILENGLPVARLVSAQRPVGFVAGRVTDDFFEPLPVAELGE